MFISRNISNKLINYSFFNYKTSEHSDIMEEMTIIELKLIKEIEMKKKKLIKNLKK